MLACATTRTLPHCVNSTRVLTVAAPEKYSSRGTLKIKRAPPPQTCSTHSRAGTPVTCSVERSTQITNRGALKRVDQSRVQLHSRDVQPSPQWESCAAVVSSPKSRGETAGWGKHCTVVRCPYQRILLTPSSTPPNVRIAHPLPCTPGQQLTPTAVR